MSQDQGNLRPFVLSWVMAAVVAVLAVVFLMVLGEFRFMAAAFIALLIALVIGGLLTWVLRPLPRFGDDAARRGGWALPAGADSSGGAPATAAPAMAAPVMATMTAADMAAPAAEFVAAPAMSLAPGGSSARGGGATDAARAGGAATGGDAGTKPQGLSGPRGGQADDLKEIEGIGPVLEKLCHDLGFYHFDQIAGWGAPEVAWMDANLKGFKGRVTRDKWVRQAQLIVAEGLPAFRIRAQTNNY